MPTYKIAEIELERGSRRGRLNTVLEVLKSNLDAIGIGNLVYLKVEGKKIAAYADRGIEDMQRKVSQGLERFAEKQEERGKPTLKVEYFGLKPVDNKERRQHTRLREDHKRLEDELAKRTDKVRQYERREIELKRELNANQSAIASLEEKLADARMSVLQKSATPATLAEVLRQNDARYEQLQRNVILRTFYELSTTIDERDLPEETEEIRAAKKCIEEREAYLSQHGEDALQLLPQKAREITEKEWAEAENIIKEYEHARKSLSETPFPINIDMSREKGETVYRVLLPIRRDSENGCSLSLRESLITAGGVLQDQYEVEVSEQAEGGLAGIELRGRIEYGIVKETILQYCSKVLLNANLKPTIVLQTSERIEEHSKHSDDERTAVESNIDLDSFVKKRIRDLGYKTFKDFSDNTNYRITDVLYRVRNGGRVKPRTVEKFAEVLQLPVEEIRRALPQDRT